MIINISNKLVLDIIKILESKKASVYLVGGAIRDFYYQKDVYDFDLEVYNISFDMCLDLLSEYDLVINEKFKTIKINKEIEIAFPRIEKKIGLTYQDYELEFNDKSIETACLRRDFTINSLMYDLINNVLYDFNNGLNDLENKCLRINNKSSFKEDPIRVLRGLDLVIRYDLNIEENTRIYMNDMAKDVLKQPDFITTRYFDKIINHDNFSNYIEMYVDYMISFMDLKEVYNVITNNEYHPEKYLIKHIIGCLKVLFLYDLSYKEYNILFNALLFHDLGKTKHNNNHEIISSKLFNEVSDKILLRQSYHKIIDDLILDHMKYREYALELNYQKMNELQKRYNNQFYLLEIMATCDYAGRDKDYNENVFKERIELFKKEVVSKYNDKEYLNWKK